MKTNHRRGFVGNDDRPRLDAWLVRVIGNDFTNGHRGLAHRKAGYKKFLRNRARKLNKRACWVSDE